jgi:hypothetical protein
MEAQQTAERVAAELDKLRKHLRRDAVAGVGEPDA